MSAVSRWARGVVALGLGLGAVHAQAAPVSGQGTWETTLEARDLTGDGVADAYYDTTLGITWLANAGAYNGAWQDSIAWATNLTVGPVRGWRLPHMTFDGGIEGCNFPPLINGSEWRQMFFVTLGCAFR